MSRAIEEASTTAAAAPRCTIQRSNRCRSGASGVVSAVLRVCGPTVAPTVVTSPQRAPGRSSTPASRVLVVVFPLLPVTVASRSRCAGSPARSAPTGPSDGPHGGDDDHGDAEVGRQPVGPVGEHGGGPGGDRPRGVAVAVGPGAADAGEQAAGAHPAGVHHQLDDGRPGADQVGGGPGTGDHGVQGGPGEGEVGEQHGPLGGQG